MKSYNATFLVKRGTTAEWAQRRGFVPKRGQLVVYMDHRTGTDDDGNEILIPGIKIGDGQAPIGALPFVGETRAQEIMDEIEAKVEETEHKIDEVEQRLDEHASDDEAHVSPEDRNFWDNKVTCEVINGAMVMTKSR